MNKTFSQSQVIELLSDKTITSISKILSKLGVCKTSGVHYLFVKKVITESNLDISHIKGKSWRKDTASLDDQLKNKSSIASHKLKLWLIQDGRKEYKCEKCQNVEWRGLKIPIQLHHINGDNKDNRIENLQILCPNCHAQTPNFCQRKFAPVVK